MACLVSFPFLNSSLNSDLEEIEQAIADNASAISALRQSVSQSTSAENLISDVVPAGGSCTLLHPIEQYRLVALYIADANSAQNTRNRLVFKPGSGAFYMPVAVGEAFQVVRFEASGTTFNFLGNTGSTKLYIRNMVGIR